MDLKVDYVFLLRIFMFLDLSLGYFSRYAANDTQPLRYSISQVASINELTMNHYTNVASAYSLKYHIIHLTQSLCTKFTKTVRLGVSVVRGQDSPWGMVVAQMVWSWLVMLGILAMD